MVVLNYFCCCSALLLIAGINSQIPNLDPETQDRLHIDEEAVPNSHSTQPNQSQPDETSFPESTAFVDPTAVPLIGETEQQLKAICLKQGGENAFAKATAALLNIRRCFTEIHRYAALPAKTHETKPNGNLDVVFRAFCQRTNEIQKCVYTFISDTDSCLADHQRQYKEAVQNVTKTILEFACENEGDHLTLFASENGLECIAQKEAAIERCIRRYLNGSESNENYLDRWLRQSDADTSSNESDSENFLALKFQTEQCEIGFGIRDCVTEELIKCSSPTPANVLESILTVVLCDTSCAQNAKCGNAVSAHYSLLSFVVPILTCFCVRRNWF